MRQTENYKNVKKISNKKVARDFDEESDTRNGSSRNGQARGILAGINLGIAENFGTFGPQIEEFIVQQVQEFADKYAGDFDDVRRTAMRYAKQYPVATIAGAAVIGLAAGLILVNQAGTAHSKRS